MNFEEGLRASLKRAGAANPVSSVSFEETLGRARRERRIYMATVAGATAALIAGGVVGARALTSAPEPEPKLPPVASLTQESSPRVTKSATPSEESVGELMPAPSESPTASPSPTPSVIRPTASPSPGPSPTVTEAPGEEAPPEEGQSLASTIPTVKTWIDAIAQGDARGAWALMSAGAKDRIGSFEEFEARLPELQEGLGAWAESPDVRYYLSVVVSSDREAVAVVTLAGEVMQEGTITTRAQAVPVLVTNNVAYVDQSFEGAYFITPKTPSENSAEGANSVGPGDTFAAYVSPSTGVRQVYFAVDGDEVNLMAKTDVIDKQKLFAFVEHSDWPLKPGMHVLTIAAETGTGQITAKSLIFEARG